MALAHDHLLKTVSQYKTEYGKSLVDQKQLIPEQYQELIWWLFPSEVLPEILALKKDHVTIEGLEKLLKNGLVDS